MSGFIPVNQPKLSEREKQNLIECVESGWVSSEGPFVKQFEMDFARYLDRKHGVSVANGTAALELAIRALNIGEGDEVIMPTFTIISCAQAITNAGAKPVLVDSDQSWNMDVSQIEAKITERTKAIMVVHTYGLCVDMDPVLSLAKKYNLKVIEDAAEVHGLDYKDRKCGSLGDISIFSFYANKLITTGEGGMVLADDDELIQRCKSLRNLCFVANPRFQHSELGWNFRMSNLQAAVGVAQLERLPESLALRRKVALRYREALEDIVDFEFQFDQTDYAKNIYWVFGVLLKDRSKFSAQEWMNNLRERGIGTRPFFWPMHKQQVFIKMGLFANESYPVAENLATRGFYLPTGNGIEFDQVEKVISTIRELV